MRTLLGLALVMAAVTPAHAQWAATAYIDDNVAGDVQSGRGGVGVTAGHYFLGGRLGLELEGELHGHFFRDEDVANLQPPGVDLNTRAQSGAGNVIVPYCVGGAGAGTWCPYAMGSLGLIQLRFKGDVFTPGAAGFDRAQTDFALGAGLGVMHALTRWVGFRVEARYLHTFVDESATGGAYSKDFGYWRLSVGVMFGGPTSAP